jgi:transcription initiation factor TFIIIB Brf1 subunit/transcription initiation factor TFIIB
MSRLPRSASKALLSNTERGRTIEQKAAAAVLVARRQVGDVASLAL